MHIKTHICKPALPFTPIGVHEGRTKNNLENGTLEADAFDKEMLKESNEQTYEIVAEVGEAVRPRWLRSLLGGIASRRPGSRSSFATPGAVALGTGTHNGRMGALQTQIPNIH